MRSGVRSTHRLLATRAAACRWDSIGIVGRVIEPSEQGADSAASTDDRTVGQPPPPPAAPPLVGPVWPLRPPVGPAAPPPASGAPPAPPTPGPGKRASAGPSSYPSAGQLDAGAAPRAPGRPGRGCFRGDGFRGRPDRGGRLRRHQCGRGRKARFACGSTRLVSLHLVHRLHAARAVGRVPRVGLARQRRPGHQQLLRGPGTPFSLDRPRRPAHRGRRPDPHRPHVHTHRPARPRLQPAVQRPLASG